MSKNLKIRQSIGLSITTLFSLNEWLSVNEYYYVLICFMLGCLRHLFYNHNNDFDTKNNAANEEFCYDK